MGTGHAHPLHHHGHSVVHRLAPEAKVLGAFVFMVAVALTPARAVWAFALYALIVVLGVASARLPIGFVLRRLLVVLPFVAFAVFVPFVATGERVEVLGLELSREGLWGSFNVLAKAILGATTGILLAGSTEPPVLLRGLERLRVPAVLTTIAAFMLRYVDLVAGELARARTAMVARGHDPRWLWQLQPLAAAAGSVFVRSHERAERVHDAMLARGFTGTMPDLGGRRAGRNDWQLALAGPACALAILTVALVATA